MSDNFAFHYGGENEYRGERKARLRTLHYDEAHYGIMWGEMSKPCNGR